MDIIEDELETKEEIELPFIYSSFANSDKTLQSDVDLMIIGNISDININRSVK
ncbi:MAG: hypothetical protein ACQEP2_05785 [Actinomycetota bacterium]